MRKVFLFGFVIFGLYFSVLAFADDSVTKKELTLSQTAGALATLDIEYGDNVSHELATARFKDILSQLSEKTKTSPYKIGESFAVVAKELKKYGILENIRKMANDFNLMMESYYPTPDFRETLAMYGVMREKGASRKKTIRGIESLLDAMNKAAASSEK